MFLTGQIIKTWGCITTCDDRLIITQVFEKNRKENYYLVTELSTEINQTYTYHEKAFPPVLKDVIMLCELMHSRLDYDSKRGRKILYGPRILRKQEDQFIYELDPSYLEKEITFEVFLEDHRIKLFLKWLQELLNHMVYQC